MERDEMPQGSRPRRLDLLHIVFFSLAYGGAIRLADLLPSSANLILALWPAGGIGLASVLLLPRRRWPAMIAGFSLTAFVTAILIGRSPLASLGFMAANALETTLAALVLTRAGGGTFNLSRLRGVVSLAVAAVVVNAVTALLGA